MKKLILLFTFTLFLFNCSDDDNLASVNNDFELLGSVFRRTSFIIDTPVDANGDGIFSNDLFEEIDNLSECTADPLFFGQFGDDRVNNPTFRFLGLTIDDSSGNQTQSIICSHVDGQGAVVIYEREGDIIRFGPGFQDVTGEISQDRNTITFTFPNELLFGISQEAGFFLGNDILREDGSIMQYEGGATVIYTIE